MLYHISLLRISLQLWCALWIFFLMLAPRSCPHWLCKGQYAHPRADSIVSHSAGVITWTHCHMQAALMSPVPLAHIDPVGQIHVATRGQQCISAPNIAHWQCLGKDNGNPWVFHRFLVYKLVALLPVLYIKTFPGNSIKKWVRYSHFKFQDHSFRAAFIPIKSMRCFWIFHTLGQIAAVFFKDLVGMKATLDREWQGYG